MTVAALPFGLLVGVIAVAMPSVLRAAGEVVPDVRLTVETNDNPALRTTNEAARDSATRLVADARFRATLFSPRSEVSIEPAVRSDAYMESVNSELENTDLFLRGAGRWQWPRWNFGFDANVDRERILGTDFLDGAFDDPTVPGDVDGVLLGQNELRNRFVFAPFTQIDLAERSRMQLDLRAMDVSYDDQPLLRVRTDFTNWEAGVSYLRVASPRTSFGARFFGGRYEAERLQNVTDGTGLEMRIEHAISSIWSVTAAVGVQRNEFTYLDNSGFFFLAGKEDNAVYDVRLRKRNERATLDVGMSRRARPDSFGTTVIRNELSAALQREFSPTLRGGVVVRAIRSDDLAVIPTQREFGRLELNLRWSLSELWGVLAGLERSYWRNSGANASANSNSIVLGLNYRGRSQRPQP